MTSILWTDFMTTIWVTDLTDLMTDILGTNYYKHTGDRLYDKHISVTHDDRHTRDNLRQTHRDQILLHKYW